MNCSCKDFNMASLACSDAGNLVDCDNSCDCDNELPIVIKGVCPPEVIEDMLEDRSRNWTQIFVPEVLCVPAQKPDIEQILNVNARVEIISQRVIKTPRLVDANDVPVRSEEGLYSTGRKLIIEGILRQKVIYTAANQQQSVHAAHFDVPFSAFIVLEEDTLLSTKYKIEACIEDVFVCGCTARQIFKNVTIFLKATPIEC
jgi:hypothetical protein